MDLEEILKTRYATKLFNNQKIPKEKIEKLLELISLSASSYNLQPWKIKIIEDQKTKEELFKVSFNQKQIITASHILVFCANLNIEENIELLEKTILQKNKNAPISDYINMLKSFANSLSKEQRLIWAQKQVYLAAQVALLASKHLGFDSCPMEGFIPQEYSKILKLPPHLVPTIVIPVGYAADTPRPKIRFLVSDILI
jgi:nitroreductase